MNSSVRVIREGLTERVALELRLDDEQEAQGRSGRDGSRQWYLQDRYKHEFWKSQSHGQGQIT